MPRTATTRVFAVTDSGRRSSNHGEQLSSATSGQSVKSESPANCEDTHPGIVEEGLEPARGGLHNDVLRSPESRGETAALSADDTYRTAVFSAHHVSDTRETVQRARDGGFLSDVLEGGAGDEMIADQCVDRIPGAQAPELRTW